MLNIITKISTIIIKDISKAGGNHMDITWFLPHGYLGANLWHMQSKTTWSKPPVFHQFQDIIPPGGILTTL